jgi:phage gpG-like protein
MPHNANQVFAAIQRRLESTIRELPRRLGTEVVRYSNQRFREQGWDGQPWQGRKGNKDAGRALLMKRGRLRRSIRIINVTADSVTIGTDVPYARIHNEGYNGTQSVRAHTRALEFTFKFSDLNTPVKGSGKFKVRKGKGAYDTKVKAFTRRMRMPQRKFLGDSPYLRRNLERIIRADMNRIMKMAA